MRKILLATIAALLAANLSAAPESTPKSCSLCSGVVSDRSTVPSATVPLLVQTTRDELDLTSTFLATLSPEQKRQTTVIVNVTKELATVDEAERQIASVVEWTEQNGPFAAFGIDVIAPDPTVEAYTLKRAAVNVQGRELASQILLPVSSLADLQKLYDTGAQAYFDVIFVDEALVSQLMPWLLEKDPAKRVWSFVIADSPNVLYDAADALRAGSVVSFLQAPNSPDLFGGVAAFNREMAGDYSPDTSNAPEVLNADQTKRDDRAVAFVRGEDLRTVVVPAGDPEKAVIVSLPADTYRNPRRIDPSREIVTKDAAKRGDRFLIGVVPVKTPVLFTLDRASQEDLDIAREAIDVETRKGISVEEIIRNHQAYWSFQESIEPRYVAKNKTDLRFGIGPGGDVVEATIAGPHFFDHDKANDWVWKDFFINGVKWKYGPIPELPIVQPEKVSQLPLDIHLTNEYRYQLAGETTIRGHKVYEVRFEPPPNAPRDLPLHRGTVFIDQKTWARVRIAMIQMNLSGEILSNEERVEYTPFDRETKQTLTAEQLSSRPSRSVLWLPTEVGAQQVLSTAGRATVVLRQTTFSEFDFADDFDAKYAEVSASPARIIRDTEEGLRYTERRPDGTRVVKEGFDASRLFLLGGIHHDAGLEYSVAPLGGIDYFNFNVRNTGLQTNVFFAGVIAAVNLTDPSFMGTRFNVGSDFFALAIPFENTIFRDGEEAEEETVKSRPALLAFRVGHPIFGFGKIDLSLGMTHLSYSKADDTAVDFRVPEDTFLLAPGVDLRYDRRGWSFATFYEFGRRTKWEPWGNLAEYSDEQQDYTKYGLTVGKSFYLPNFQRFSAEVNYLDGTDLDRFSKYELGFFGSQRIRGIQSGSVRAERALLGHLAYGLVFSQQFRLEAFYDHGLIDDEASGFDGEAFQGIGIGGQTIGPYGTIVRMDIGKSIGSNAQDDFVANIIFLKLFN